MDIVPDIALAGLGAATLPIAPAWSAVLVALYIWNKVLRGSTEEFSDAEALAMLALWKNRTGMNEISEALGFTKTNELRAEYSLSPLTEGQFNSIVVRFREIRCIEPVDGIIRLREWVNVEYP